MTDKITAYKGFHSDWTCRGFRYEIGQTYVHDRPVVRCADGGFHACEHPLDVWTYYPPTTSVFAEVEARGEIARGPDGDTKIAAAQITIKAERSLGEMGRRAVAWVADMAKKQGNGQFATGGHGHAAATGDYGHAAATGNYGHAAATGGHGHAAATGDYGHAAAAGYRGHAAAAGNMGHAAASGYRGHAAATGGHGHAAATGDYGHAAATGDYGHAAAAGYGGIAAALGNDGAAQASAGGAIMIAAYDDDGNLVAVRASMVGENGIEAGKAYRLTAAGAFEEVL